MNKPNSLKIKIMDSSPISIFLKQHGISLFNDYGINDYVLSSRDSLTLIELAKKEIIPIIGGDVYSIDDNNNLLLGDYYWLSWSCNRNQDETVETKSYFERSIEMAEKQIVKVENTARKKNVLLYINFVF